MSKSFKCALVASFASSALLNAELNSLTEVRASYFYPTSKTIRDVYGTGGVNYGIAFSSYVWKDLAVKVSGDFFSKEGRSVNGDEKTKIEIYPISLGSFYAYKMGIHRVYGGAGFRYFFVKVKNDSPYVSSRSDGNGLGGYVEGGYMVTVDDWLTFDFFANYGFRKLGMHSKHLPNVTQTALEVGGLNVGAGVGFKF